MPKISAEEAARRKAAVIAAARACFARRGFEETSMDQICEEAAVSKGALYGYFKSKDDLILAVAEAQQSRLREIEQASTKAELLDQLTALLEVGDRRSAAARLEVNAITRSFSDKKLRGRYIANRAQMLRSIEVAMTKLAPAIESTAAARLLDTFILGSALQTALSPEAAHEEDIAILLALLVPRPA